jgi:hypothetical protein
MTISNYLEGLILTHVLTTSTAAFVTTTAVYGSLHTGDPGETGTGNPLASCARFPIHFSVPASSTSVNDEAASVVASATGTITHMALWDGSATNTANCLWYGSLTTPKNVNAGDTINLASGALAVSLD